MKKKYTTARLVLKRLSQKDNIFIYELLNSEGWKIFIGDRGIKTTDDSQEYIQLTLRDANITYWVVKTRAELVSIGIISFIKRSYLDQYDLGFAFLPAFLDKGYAFEAASAILNDLLADPLHHTILATTRIDNFRSVKLLEKLGFHFEKEMENDNKRLLLYSISRP
jgi:[ribosomal protein S5]-alanine N-acetyltransferase